MEMKPQKTRFHIKQCSSQDPSHPIKQLVSSSPKARGWKSAPFCSYPQTIIIEFENVVDLKDFQLLSHQSAISSKIELSLQASEGAEFTRLGKFSLDSNASTDYKTREFKSVRVDSKCLALRLSFAANHPNEYNPYNQVGVIAISCYSQPVKASNKPSAYPPAHQPVYDTGTAVLLENLEEQKRKAVENEDYDLARSLKEKIAKAKDSGRQLKELEDRKLYAVSVEDYDTAKTLNQKIRQLRQQSSGPEHANSARPMLTKQRTLDPQPEQEPDHQRRTFSIPKKVQKEKPIWHSPVLKKETEPSYQNEFDQEFVHTMTPQCQQCGMQSAHFSSPDVLDYHLYRSCKATAQCECGFIVKVPELDTHRLGECANSSSFRQCGKCKAAVNVRDGSHQCMGLARGKAVCPLCSQQVSSDKEGWTKHLVQDCQSTRAG